MLTRAMRPPDWTSWFEYAELAAHETQSESTRRRAALLLHVHVA